MATTFPHRHLLDIERLSKTDIETVLSLAARYAEQNRSKNKKCDKLHGKTVVNLFFENSTRTCNSFEIAAKRLSADVINVPVQNSSMNKKGETLLDTILTLDAMQTDIIVIRHQEPGLPHFVAPHVKAHVISAGDGKNEHPTQALLDALTMLRHKGRLDGLMVAICGDIEHSRVCHSNIRLLRKMGAHVRLIAPEYFSTKDYDSLGVEHYTDLDKGIAGADVVMPLRIQIDRMQEGELTTSFEDYHKIYGLTHERLTAAKPDVIVMSPGPNNRGVEITSELMDDPRLSVIREQVEMGVAVRMAVMDLLMDQSN